MLEAIVELSSGVSAVMALSGFTCVLAIMAIQNNRQLKKQKRLQVKLHRRHQEDMRALSKSAVGMGQKILATERKLADVLKKQVAILNSQPEHPTYDQASKLIAMGASEGDLINSCGFSHAEAELLLSLNKHSQHKSQAMH